MKPFRVRFAPSPTGALHIGGIRTAMYNYLLAKQHGGTFILRIEDTDQVRLVPGAEEYIIEALQWVGLVPDEGPGFGGAYGPYRQSERKEIYGKYALQLIQSGHAYYAFDSVEELEEMRVRLEASGVPAPKYNVHSRLGMRNSLNLSSEETNELLSIGTPYVVRLKVPADEQIHIQDLIRGHVVFESNELDDKVILKADGMPTYHLANIVDDYLMQISHVIR
ncbi:MAG: glutamate--tRNA ligase family protein, partial [Saprospiraceae bacterium]